MVEVHSYDITAHERYAYDQQEIEAFRKQYHVPPSGAKMVAVQTRVMDFIPKHPAIVMLMQTYQRKMWARFMIPKNYYTQRFTSSYVAPSLGSTEKQDADIYKIHAFLKNQTRGRKIRRKEERDEESGEKSRDEELMDESDALIEMMEKGVKETNEMVDFVISRMHQFVQA